MNSINLKLKNVTREIKVEEIGNKDWVDFNPPTLHCCIHLVSDVPPPGQGLGFLDKAVHAPFNILRATSRLLEAEKEYYATKAMHPRSILLLTWLAVKAWLAGPSLYFY